ncbi:hypothetical protein D3C80_1774390 [compost metagenome]
MLAPAHHIVEGSKSTADHAIKWRLGRKRFYPALHRLNIFKLQLMLHLAQETYSLAKAVQQGEVAFRTHNRQRNTG